jgi:hypothetical protein
MRRVRLFNRALEPDEIANLAKTQDAAFPEGKGPVADYAMDKIVDGLIQNNVGGGLNAKVVGDVQIDASGPAPEAVFAGNGSLEVAYDPKLALVDAFTLEAYICPGKLPDSGARIIDRLTAGKDDGFLLDTCPGNSLRAITEMGTVAYDAKLVPERWVHVAVTFDKNGELRLFLQGAKVAGAAAKKQAPTVALAPIIAFHRKICALGMQNTYEARHAAIALDYFSAMHMRKKMLEEGTLKKLPDVSQAAADKSYVDTMYKLAGGLQRVLESYEESDDPAKKKIAEIWDSVQGL